MARGPLYQRRATVTVLVAAGTAIMVLLAGSLPWGPLIGLNLRAGITMPWAVVPMALYLGAYWMVVSGRWFGAASGPQRRINLRAVARRSRRGGAHPVVADGQT